jgi:heme-degrading monooxygenase HmoA
MAMLKKHHAPGFALDLYQQLLDEVKPSQSAADGFVSHYGIAEGDGLTVIEVWDSVAAHDAWFDVAVRPELPPDTPEPEFFEIVGSNTK